MPLSSILRDIVDPILEDAASQLETKQTAYHSLHGCYWQGSAITNTAPVGGTEVEAHLDRHPTDQTESWMDLEIEITSPIPLQIRVDTYISQGGDGYTVCGLVTESDVTYCRVINVGPENRGHDWE